MVLRWPIGGQDFDKELAWGTPFPYLAPSPSLLRYTVHPIFYEVNAIQRIFMDIEFTAEPFVFY